MNPPTIARDPPLSQFNSLCSQHHHFPDGGSLHVIRIENIILSTILSTHNAPPELALITNKPFNPGSKETKFQILQIRYP
jgi:hypothetical protein